ncbi:MAG TPA: ATPase domain-containing protein [Blastocatellia bacterium]|nr:ATPase domain-containing protein [Blastocatellia bacterium]
MDAQARKTIPSGIEPIDRLMRGLDSGRLYLVHGEAAGKSLFGILFLIAGLKRGEHVALVIRSSPEDAVRRFARLGYDCLEDIYSGRLVILDFSDDLIPQTARLEQLTPALREIEWLLGETRPLRLVFDPVTSVVVSEQANLEARVAEFARWTRSLGATVLLTASADNSEIIRFLTPHVVESLRLEVREAADHATRFIAFEKALTIPDQPIEVDPSRGVFLLDRAQGLKQSSTSHTSFDFGLLEVDAPAARKQQPSIISLPEAKAPAPEYGSSRENPNGLLDLDLESIEDVLARLVEEKKDDIPVRPQSPPPQPSWRLQQPSAETPKDTRGNASPFASELPGELAGVFFPGDLGSGQASPRQTSGGVRPVTTKSLEKSPSGLEQMASEAGTDSGPAPFENRKSEPARPEPNAAAPAGRRAASRNRASDIRIDAALAARAVETLLSQPNTKRRPSDPTTQGVAESAADAAVQEPVDPRSLKVLVVVGDANTCALIAQSLDDFTIEQVHDAMSGLAKLISSRPDLVILDVDLPVIDGFKLLGHIRASLNVPVIIVSGTLLRSSDRVMSAELGADYHLTKPFSAKELWHKARQLIARYRGIDSWIINPPGRAVDGSARHSGTTAREQPGKIDDQRFAPYHAFAAEVEKRVKAILDHGSALWIVGCRVPQMTTTHGGFAQLRLREIVRHEVRDTDLTSTNPPGDVVVLLADAAASGARAFASRLREVVAQKMNQEPSLWTRSFPEREAGEAASSPAEPTNGDPLGRRASDSPTRG